MPAARQSGSSSGTVSIVGTADRDLRAVAAALHLDDIVGCLEERDRVHRMPVDPHLVMEMIAGRASGRSHPRDQVSAAVDTRLSPFSAFFNPAAASRIPGPSLSRNDFYTHGLNVGLEFSF